MDLSVDSWWSLMTQEQDERREALLAFYSHTSRVWNSAITLTLAGAGVSIAVVTSGLFGKVYSRLGFWLVFALAVLLYLGVVYGLMRVVELGEQLQLLESEIEFRPEAYSPRSSLLEYISDKVPRIGSRERLTKGEVQRLRGRKLSILEFYWQHIMGSPGFTLMHTVAFSIWTVVFWIVLALRLFV
jgi:hypothetical protein